MDQKEFNDIKKGLHVILTQPFNNLQEEAASYAHEIHTHDYNFHRSTQEAQILKGISQDSLIEFYDKHFIQTPNKLEVHVVSHHHKANYLTAKEQR